MADGLKLNLKEALLLKNAEGVWWEIKGKNSLGADFSWQSPVVYTIDVAQQFDRKFEFFMTGVGAGTHRIDWGDGDITETSAPNGGSFYSHTYSASTGIYDVHITATVPFSIATIDNNIATIGIKGYYGNGRTILSTCNSIRLVSVTSYLPPTIRTMNYAFSRCYALNSPNLVLWDTSRVTSMQGTFTDCFAFNQDISVWDTSNVLNMRDMFDDARAFNQDISVWDTSKVTTMRRMFNSADAFNQDLGAMPINSVTDMVDMFGSINGLSTENYSRTLIGWANQHYAGNAQNNVPLGAANKTYNSTAYTTGNQFNDAVSARAYLVGTAGWTITDGGQV